MADLLYENTSLNVHQDISCPEAVKLDDLDGAAIQKNYEAAKAAFSSAEIGSVAKAEAEIAMETNKAMATAIGLAI
jgi:F0F1-type ATP synthase epsilon subunit